MATARRERKKVITDTGGPHQDERVGRRTIYGGVVKTGRQ